MTGSKTYGAPGGYFIASDYLGPELFGLDDVTQGLAGRTISHDQDQRARSFVMSTG